MRSCHRIVDQFRFLVREHQRIGRQSLDRIFARAPERHLGCCTLVFGELTDQATLVELDATVALCKGYSPACIDATGQLYDPVIGKEID